MNIPSLEDFELFKKELLESIKAIIDDKPQQKMWLNKEEACTFLDCCETKLANLRNDGKIPFSKNGAAYLYYQDDLHNYLWSNRVCLN